MLIVQPQLQNRFRVQLIGDTILDELKTLFTMQVINCKLNLAALSRDSRFSVTLEQPTENTQAYLMLQLVQDLIADTKYQLIVEALDGNDNIAYSFEVFTDGAKKKHSTYFDYANGAAVEHRIDMIGTTIIVTCPPPASPQDSDPYDKAMKGI